MASEDSFSIYKYLQFCSIEGKLRKTDVAFERKVRRWYAKELGQSVKDTYNLPWTEIVSHYYDSQIEETPFNIIYNMAIDEYVPELAEEQDALDQAYADSLVEEQKATLAKKKTREKPEVEPKDKADEILDKAEDNKKEIEMSFNMDNPDKDL